MVDIFGSPYILPPFSFQPFLATISWPEGLFSCRISGFPLFKVSESWCAFLDWVTLPSLRIWAPNSFFNPPKIHDYTLNQKVRPNFSLKIFTQIRCPLVVSICAPKKNRKICEDFRSLTELYRGSNRSWNVGLPYSLPTFNMRQYFWRNRSHVPTHWLRYCANTDRLIDHCTNTDN